MILINDYTNRKQCRVQAIVDCSENENENGDNKRKV